MRLFAVIDVEVVNFDQKKVKIDLILLYPYDYLRCELHNCNNGAALAAFYRGWWQSPLHYGTPDGYLHQISPEAFL